MIALQLLLLLAVLVLGIAGIEIAFAVIEALESDE